MGKGIFRRPDLDKALIRFRIRREYHERLFRETYHLQCRIFQQGKRYKRADRDPMGPRHPYLRNE